MGHISFQITLESQIKKKSQFLKDKWIILVVSFRKTNLNLSQEFRFYIKVCEVGTCYKACLFKEQVSKL